MAKLLWIFPGWGRSGGARVVGEHINRLADRGHDCLMFSQDGKRPDWFDLNCAVLSNPLDLRVRVDAVIATNPTTVEQALIPSADRRFYFVQMAEHLFFSPESAEYSNSIRTYKLAARQDFRFITIAKWLKEYLETLKPNQDIPIIPNGVGPEFSPLGEKGDYILVEGDDRNCAKDVEAIGWRVAMKLREQYGIQLHGMAAVKHRYHSHLDNFVLNPSVEDYRRLYSGARFMIKASKYEGRSLSPLEAMACGTVTCRAIINGDDDLLHRRNCLRVDYDFEKLLSAAHLLMDDSSGLLNMLVHNANMYAERKLSWDPIIDQLEMLLLG